MYSFSEDGTAQVNFHCAGGQPLTDEQRQRLAQTLSLKLQEHKSTYESDEEEGENKNATVMPPQAYVYYSARGQQSFARQNGKIVGEIPLAALMTQVREAGLKELEVYVTHPDLGFAEFPQLTSTSPVPAISTDFSFHQYRLSLQQPAFQTLSFRFGEPDGVRWNRYLPLIAILVIPLLITLLTAWAKLREHRREPGSVTVVSPGFLSVLGHTLPVLWWITLYFTKADHTFKSWLHSPSELNSTLAWMALYVAPPLLVILLCQAIHQYVVGKITGDEKQPTLLLRQAILQIVTTILPSLLFMYGMYAMVMMKGRQGITYFLLFFLLSSLTSKWRWKAMGLTPYIVPSGALRNRIFALAQQGGVKLREAFLIADTNGRTVNAFASMGENILLTEYILSQFTRRELDFIVSHELSHLRRKHIQKQLWVSVLTIPALLMMNSFLAGFVMTLFVLAGAFVPALSQWGLSLYLPLTVAFSLLLIVFVKMFISRRFEYEADAGGVALTNDPEAAIRALVKLGKLSLQPMDWGKLNGKLLTHPSVKERANAIAQAYRLNNEQLEILMTTPDDDPARYAAHTETHDAVKALPPTSAPKPTNLPQTRETSPFVELLVRAVLGMGFAWLVLTPGYAPQQFFATLQFPPWLTIALMGFISAAWYCIKLKQRLAKTMSQHQEFLPVEILESPAITTAAEMNTFMAYTDELESLGFKYVADYTVAQSSKVPMNGVARLFIHTEYHCYAEVAHLAVTPRGKKKTWCSIQSGLTGDFAISTTNQYPDAVSYATRLPKRFWSCHVDSSMTDLLEIHLEQRGRVRRESQQNVLIELGREEYFSQLRKASTLRRESFCRNNIMRFMYDLERFKHTPKMEWWGKFTVAKAQQSTTTNPAWAE